MSSPCDFNNCSITCSNFPSCGIPLPPLPPLPSFTPNHQYEPNNMYKNGDNKHTEIVVAAFSITVFLFVMFAAVRCLRNSEPHHNEPFPPPPPPTPAPITAVIQTTNPNNNDDNDDDVTRHVWIINTVGLDDHVIKSIAASVYNRSNTDAEYCTVCLGEFSDGEEIKLLQNCCHVFHVLCIDTWLKSHVNCPLCRKAVMEGSDCLEGTRITNSEPGQRVIGIDSVSEFGSSSRSMENEDDMMSIK